MSKWCIINVNSKLNLNLAIVDDALLNYSFIYKV
jgi:hypothetical protein